MDYSYFHSAPQAYQFLGLPPTPGHSGSAVSSEDYSHSPTQQQQQHDGFDQYPNFDFHTHYATTTANGNPALPKSATPLAPHKQMYEVNGYADSSTASVSATTADLSNGGVQGQGQSNSEDDDMTPAQSRRKAQNRAAQRAFRERKERHVKDLEAKLLALESTSASISAENERLKIQLQRASTENEILKATSSSSAAAAHAAAYGSSPPPPTTTTGPQRYSPTNFYSDLLQSHENKTPSHRIVVSEAGERLLAAGAAWDYIITHPLFLRGLVDVGDVSERLKRLAKCDGQGPVFEERAIIRAIELSVASGSDELL